MKDFRCADDVIKSAVDEYSDNIYRIALNITKNRDDAFDVCQEVFLRLVKNKQKIKDGEHLKAWLLRAAVNCSKSFVTQGYRRHTVALDECLTAEIVERSDGLELLEKVLSLPPKYSSAIHLYYYEDLRIDEIAAILGVGKSAVKSRLSRGRKMLKEQFEKENNYG